MGISRKFISLEIRLIRVRLALVPRVLGENFPDEQPRWKRLRDF